MISRMRRNRSLGTATSAIWNRQLVAGFGGSWRGLLCWYGNDAGAERDLLHGAMIYAISGSFWT
jgi:hypothetical protein